MQRAEHLDVANHGLLQAEILGHAHRQCGDALAVGSGVVVAGVEGIDERPDRRKIALAQLRVELRALYRLGGHVRQDREEPQIVARERIAVLASAGPQDPDQAIAQLEGRAHRRARPVPGLDLGLEIFDLARGCRQKLRPAHLGVERFIRRLGPEHRRAARIDRLAVLGVDQGEIGGVRLDAGEDRLHDGARDLIQVQRAGQLRAGRAQAVQLLEPLIQALDCAFQLRDEALVCGPLLPLAGPEVQDRAEHEQPQPCQQDDLVVGHPHDEGLVAEDQHDRQPGGQDHDEADGDPYDLSTLLIRVLQVSKRGERHGCLLRLCSSQCCPAGQAWPLPPAARRVHLFLGCSVLRRLL